MGVFSQLRHAWNAFLNLEERYLDGATQWGSSYGSAPDRPRLRITSERSIISAIYLRLALDFASIDMRHVKLDELDRYQEDMKKSGLYNCLTLEANIDQSAQAFFIDAALTLFDEGYIALVPIDTSVSPNGAGSVDIETMRVGKIVQWFPRHVIVDAYNDRTGRREQIPVSKTACAIIENPFYQVMNEPNSLLQRLTRKLSLLDQTDEKNSSNKLDLLIQLPYMVKGDARAKQSKQRQEDIEFQLTGSQHGIAFIDGTEKVIQLNRPVENTLLPQIEWLTTQLYGHLGLTPEIMLGTATEEAMLNYINRTQVLLLTAFSQEMKRKFLSKTARTQGQSVEFFRDPFKLVPMKDLAEMADKFTRNEIFTANEFRTFLGIKPSTDPKADKLQNSNMPHFDPDEAVPPVAPEDEPEVDEEEDEFDPFAGINETLDEMFSSVEEELANAGS
jgi:hypothetical protein